MCFCSSRCETECLWFVALACESTADLRSEYSEGHCPPVVQRRHSLTPCFLTRCPSLSVCPPSLHLSPRLWLLLSCLSAPGSEAGLLLLPRSLLPRCVALHAARLPGRQLRALPGCKVCTVTSHTALHCTALTVLWLASLPSRH